MCHQGWKNLPNERGRWGQENGASRGRTKTPPVTSKKAYKLNATPPHRAGINATAPKPGARRKAMTCRKRSTNVNDAVQGQCEPLAG
ncbi:MAG: hypothetical protein ACTSXP_09920 [Promethearchaeota archaeon]